MNILKFLPLAIVEVKISSSLGSPLLLTIWNKNLSKFWLFYNKKRIITKKREMKWELKNIEDAKPTLVTFVSLLFRCKTDLCYLNPIHNNTAFWYHLLQLGKIRTNPYDFSCNCVIRNKNHQQSHWSFLKSN